MIDVGNVYAVARSEGRLTRRLFRFWIFFALAFVLGLVALAWYGLLHYFASANSATIAIISPRYLLTYIGNWYVLVFLVGLVFVGFDVRSRDRRERMDEVLDALPTTNLELLLGKFLGILITAWLPTLVVALVILLLGMLTGESIQPLSLATFTLVMIPPAYAAILGLVFFVSLLVKHRLIAALIVIGVMGGMFVTNFLGLRLYWFPPVDLAGAFAVPFVSDLTPSLLNGYTVVQRMGFLLVGVGFLLFAVAVHPRRDDMPRKVPWAGGALALVIGVGMLLGLVFQAQAGLARKASWRVTHEAIDEAFPDVTRIAGSVRIDPGDEIALDLEIAFRAPADASLERAIFSLNPGIALDSVEIDGSPARAEHEDGLLIVTLPRSLEAGEEGRLRLVAAGAPAPEFSYLDSVIEPLAQDARDSQLVLMGFDPIVFRGDYVALMPGARWLPASGPEVGRRDPGRRPTDFYRLDLEVQLPERWLVAGPGRRREEGPGHFRFAPDAPVPDVALIASRFASYQQEIEGITFELLVDPDHVENVEYFADAADEVEAWISERLLETERAGLGYPYKAFTLVEVPNGLRGYGGGWRMDSTFYQPGMILMRESSFPTAQFAFKFRDPDSFEDREGGLPRAKRQVLEDFFERDFVGGNPFLGASRNFLAYQTAGTGPAGLPMDYVAEDLSNRFVTEKQGYFSIHHFDRDLNQTIGVAMLGAFSSGSQRNIAEEVIRGVTQRLDVWDQILGVGLIDLEPYDDPKRTLDVLTLKGGAMARSMIDELGRSKTGELLGALRERARGRNFTREDLLAAGEDVGVDLTEWFDVWMQQTDLPGFRIQDVDVRRISDSEEGQTRYQIRLTLRNHEDVPGLIRVSWIEGSGQDARQNGETDPIRIEGRSAMEIGVVTAEPPTALLVEPYLSLNRGRFNVNLPPIDEEDIDDAEPFVGHRSVEWVAEEEDGMVVDDLDAGFEVVDEARRPFWQVFGGPKDDEVTDGGLPLMLTPQAPARWSRWSSTAAYGEYRRTMAIARSGKGDRRAIFRAELPRAGSWELELHLPPRRGERSLKRGTYNLTLIDPSGEQPVTFDADNAEPGWNLLGRFEVARGDVRVELSNRSEGGRVVIADAIRWRPSAAGSQPSD